MPFGRITARGNEPDKKDVPVKKPLSDKPPGEDERKTDWKLDTPKYRMSDLILSESTKKQLSDVISFSKNRDKLFRTWGLEEKYRDRDGLTLNLYGPSGTGKSMAGHAIADALGLPIICVSYAEMVSKYVGETSKNLESLFTFAASENAVILLDEADAVLSKRVTNMTSAADVSVNQTRNVLLTLLDNYRGVVIFTSNFIRNYDSAFMRRIKFHIHFSLPDETLRKRLWEEYIPARMPTDADCAKLAALSDEVSGGDISNAVFIAAVGSAEADMVEHTRFVDAIQRTLEAKRENETGDVTISRRLISQEEAEQFQRKA